MIYHAARRFREGGIGIEESKGKSGVPHPLTQPPPGHIIRDYSLLFVVGSFTFYFVVLADELRVFPGKWSMIYEVGLVLSHFTAGGSPTCARPRR